MASIDLIDVSVDYPIYNASSRSLKNSIIRKVGGALGKDSSNHVVINALRDVNLSLKPGDRLGVIGHNGAGKSTLLRVLAGIFEPPRGIARIEGRVAALFDLGMGMDTEATGYENILLRSVILGMSIEEARKLTPEIEDFSELGGYLHLPIRTYSSGMQLRLAFAISTAAAHDIVLMDELISVGDVSFMRKAEKRVNAMLDRADILVLASHNYNFIRRFCRKVVHMDGGRIVGMAETPEQIEALTAA